MDLPDCPPGAEGYEDTVTEVPKKDPSCTKAEQEFQDHLNSLKIKLEDGSTRPMVERCGRDISGKWIYLCYPCAAVCSGETILQTHISGKKHKSKLGMTTVWPLRIFTEHPYHQHQAGTDLKKPLEKPVQETAMAKEPANDLDIMFDKYKNGTCHIQEQLDLVKAPLVGLEYLCEHPPEEEHHEPKYICTLCFKQGHPRTIINHLTCFWHRVNYASRHFPKACSLLGPYRSQPKYREGVSILTNRLVQRIEDKYGRMKPINIDKEVYDKHKDRIHQWIYYGEHFSEKEDCTFEEVIDVGLIESVADSGEKSTRPRNRNEPSPPIVPAPSKPHFNHFSRRPGRRERRAGSIESLSDISDDLDIVVRDNAKDSTRSRYAIRNNVPERKSSEKEKTRAPNYEYKVKLADEKRKAAEEFAKKTLAYHEKNPEKHPLYPEEWKKFWNKRYKEIQAEGKDPSKYDFKPEWIVFWTARMKELHEQELRTIVNEIYRKMCLSPPDMNKKSPERSRSTEISRRSNDHRRRTPPEKRRRSPECRRRSPESRRRSPEFRRRSPKIRRRSPESSRRSPEPRRRSPVPRRRSPELYRNSQDLRHRSPVRRKTPEMRKDRRSADVTRSPHRLRSIERARSPAPHRARSRSRSPHRRGSPHRTRIPLESIRRSQSPLSQREMQPRNRSPEPVRMVEPSLQTVMISDDELKPDDGLSPWNSDNDIASVGSGGDRSRTESLMSRGSRARSRRRPSVVMESTAPDDVIGTLRVLVALEDYLGSLGPKLVDLLAEALKMEKECANSSEQLLVRESAVVLVETAKEKLKGAVQAGLVAGSAASAARAAVVRAAATLHEADKRIDKAHSANKTISSTISKKAAVPVAGIGEVDRAQIAQQMAEALIAQGKTDVSSEELAQLVDAVVGMAEAKKREAGTRPLETRPPLLENSTSRAAPGKSGTATALQMLQSAYDENDKRTEKEEGADAMDGLSDSDLETLLKNFNELSAEEQHSLIAYLKKLEAKEPLRVEKLRQYVSDAAHAPGPPRAAPGPPPPAPGPPPPRASLAPSVLPGVRAAPRSTNVTTDQVIIESDDDDDYTVDEVFQSATKKVKEDQIRQEMEIVKKSLEETNTSQPDQSSKRVPSEMPINAQNFSSASDLFALVQASIKATPAATPATIMRSMEVVASGTQPRSFGDLPETAMVNQVKSMQPSSILNLLSSVKNQEKSLLNTPNVDNRSQLVNDCESQPQNVFNKVGESPYNNLNQSNQLSNDQFNPGEPSNDFNQTNLSQVNQPSSDCFDQGKEQLNERFNDINQPLINRFNQINQSSNNHFNRPPVEHFNQGQSANIRFNPGNQPPKDQFNQGYQPNNQFSQGYSPPNNQFNQDYQQSNDQFSQDYQQSNDQFSQDYQQSNDQFRQSYQPPRDQFNQGYQPHDEQFNQSNQQGNQWNQRTDTRPPMRGPNNSGPMRVASNNFGPRAPYNQDPRMSFMNSRGQDNFDNRPQNQPFGNQQNSFRGRGGRGHYGGGPMRGRGRGHY